MNPSNNFKTLSCTPTRSSEIFCNFHPQFQNEILLMTLEFFCFRLTKHFVVVVVFVVVILIIVLEVVVYVAQEYSNHIIPFEKFHR